MAPLLSRLFSSSGFRSIDPSIKLEEETLSFYDPRMFYPVRLYRALKVHINTLQHNRELDIYQHLNSPALQQSEHGGNENLRELYDYFRVEGPYGSHDVFVLRALRASIWDLQKLMPDCVFDHQAVPDILLQILLTVHFLHTEADVTHTDIHAGNLIQGVESEQRFAEIEEDKISGNLAPRKDVGDRTIYTSRLFCEPVDRLYLCDLGEALVGNENIGPAMPKQYRAPEVILGMKWGDAIDQCSVGVMAWDMMQPVGLSKIYDPEDESINNAHRLAAIITLLGPPPRGFLDKSQEYSKYWDENGNWRNIVPIPS